MKKILHADDVERFRNLVEGALQDFEVISTDNCDQVVVLAHEHQPDLVILDHLMPSEEGNTGFEVCQKLREERPELPIVVFTGAWEDVGSPEEVERVWQTKVVFKNEGAQKLAKVVRELLEPSVS